MTRGAFDRRPSHPDLFLPVRDQFRSVCLGALALTAAVAAYISWVPFNFEPPSDRTLDAIRAALVPSVVSRVNFVANVVLFIPFGLFGAGACGLETRSGWNRRLWSAGLLSSSFLLSVAIEGLQVLLPGRTPAASDVIAQVGGTTVGAAGWGLVGNELRAWMVNRRRQTEPLLLLLHAAVVGLVVGSLFPLDVTLSLSTLAQKYRSGGILLVPFQGQALPAGLQDVAEKLLFASPLGAWCMLAWTPRGHCRRLVPAILASIVFLTALEICQVVVMSRVADVTDILTGAAGASAGAWMAQSRSSSRPHERRSTLAPAGLAVSIALYTIFNWSPFDFALSKTLFETRWSELMQVPFLNYYAHSEIQAVCDFALKFSMAVPIGLLAGLAAGIGRREFRRLFFVASSIVAGGLFFAIEVGQIFLPSRFPDVTDVLIGVLGFASGVAMPMMFHSSRLFDRN